MSKCPCGNNGEVLTVDDVNLCCICYSQSKKFKFEEEYYCECPDCGHQFLGVPDETLCPECGKDFAEPMQIDEGGW